jgi:hypothetical protein
MVTSVSWAWPPQAAVQWAQASGRWKQTSNSPFLADTTRPVRSISVSSPRWRFFGGRFFRRSLFGFFGRKLLRALRIASGVFLRFFRRFILFGRIRFLDCVRDFRAGFFRFVFFGRLRAGHL